MIPISASATGRGILFKPDVEVIGALRWQQKRTPTHSDRGLSRVGIVPVGPLAIVSVSIGNALAYDSHRIE